MHSFYIYYMPFLRLQSVTGKTLCRGHLPKSHAVYSGWGTICPREADVALIFAHQPLNFPSLPYSPNCNPIIKKKSYICHPKCQLSLTTPFLKSFAFHICFHLISENYEKSLWSPTRRLSHIPVTRWETGSHWVPMGINSLVSWRRLN